MYYIRSFWDGGATERQAHGDARIDYQVSRESSPLMDVSMFYWTWVDERRNCRPHFSIKSNPLTLVSAGTARVTAPALLFSALTARI